MNDEDKRHLRNAVRLMDEDLKTTSVEMVDIVLLADAAETAKKARTAPVVSGYEDLDQCLDGGFRQGDFSVISGVSGEGKTSFCRCLTLNFAKNDIPSLWLSYEMNIPELWESFEKMGAQSSLLSYVPVTLEQDLAWILAHIDVAVKTKGVRAIFIDTLGDVVKLTKERNEANNYALQLTGICKAFRTFAIQNNVMIFVVAHAVKTGIRKDVDKETYNDDIAYSAGIVQTATNIFHIWRRKDAETIVKIGKSRRDGSAHGKKLSFQFRDNILLATGIAMDSQNDTREF